LGSVAAGIASVGGSLAQAKELQRQEMLQKIKIALEQSKLATEQGRLGIEQSYADTNAQRLKLEQDREKRLAAEAGKDHVEKWQLVGNTVIAAGQKPDGTPFVKSMQVDREVGMELRALQQEIAQAPPEIQPLLTSMTNEKIAEGDIKGAADAIKPIMQSVAKGMLPGPVTVTTGTDKFPIYLSPEQASQLGVAPGINYIQVPTTRQSQRLPAGSAPGIPQGGGGLPAIPAPVSSGATDRPAVPQQSVPGDAVDKALDSLFGKSKGGGQPGGVPATAAKPSPASQLPPGSRIIGPKAGPSKLKPEMEASLRVLHVSLFGGDLPGMPRSKGLDSALGVLDSPASRAKMIAAGVGFTPPPEQGIVSKGFQAVMYSNMTDAELDYTNLLNNSVSAINALRTFTGLPRSTQALMDRYILELPNPINTPSSAVGRRKLMIIERDIQAAMFDALKQMSVSGDVTSGR
jgi:hypothetical protein